MKLLRGEINKLMKQDGCWVAWDDVANVELDAIEVKQPRAEEMRYVRQMGVYTKVPRDEARRAGLKPIGVRWFDINKGDWNTPVYRSRLVGQEFRTTQYPNFFAATSPLDALRMLSSRVATRGRSTEC